MARQRLIIFGLVGIEIVQNHMNFAVRVAGDDAVHEIQELDAPTALVVAGLDPAGGHLQREQGDRAMAFVFMVETGQRLAVIMGLCAFGPCRATPYNRTSGI